MTRIPKEIRPRDQLGREIFSGKLWRPIVRREYISPEVFGRVGETRISVDRMGLAPDTEMAMIGDANAALRGENRNFYGWIIISAQDVRRQGREVEVTPRVEAPANPYHADIRLPDHAQHKESLWNEHVTELAAKARPRSKPDLPS